MDSRIPFGTRLVTIKNFDLFTDIADLFYMDEVGSLRSKIAVPQWMGGKDFGLILGYEEHTRFIAAEGVNGAIRMLRPSHLPAYKVNYSLGSIDLPASANPEDFGSPVLATGEVLLKGKAGGQVYFDNSGEVDLSTIDGIRFSLAPVEQLATLKTPAYFAVTDGSIFYSGDVRRFKEETLDDEDMKAIDKFRGVSGESHISTLGDDLENEAVPIDINFAGKEYKRNPALAETFFRIFDYSLSDIKYDEEDDFLKKYENDEALDTETLTRYPLLGKFVKNELCNFRLGTIVDEDLNIQTIHKDSIWTISDTAVIKSTQPCFKSLDKNSEDALLFLASFNTKGMIEDNFTTLAITKNGAHYVNLTACKPPEEESESEGDLKEISLILTADGLLKMFFGDDLVEFKDNSEINFAGHKLVINVVNEKSEKDSSPLKNVSAKESNKDKYKDAIVLNVTGNVIQNIDGNVERTIEGDLKETVKGKAKFIFEDEVEYEYQKKIVLKVLEELNFDEKVYMKAKELISLKAKKVDINGTVF